MSDPSVSVCFPAYNEEATIRDVVVEAYSLLKNTNLSYEILVCDDGSTDNTGAIIDELQKTIPTLTVFHNSVNRGMRYTFELLNHQARMDFVFLNSADRQWPTHCIFDLLPLTQDFDIIIASRTNKHYGIIRSFVSWAYDNVPHLIFGIGKHDFGAVKLVRREIIEAFTLVSRSPFTEAERLIRAARAGYRITDYPVETRPREAGVATGAKPNLIFEAVIDLLRVWRDLKSSTGNRTIRQ